MRSRLSAGFIFDAITGNLSQGELVHWELERKKKRSRKRRLKAMQTPAERRKNKLRGAGRTYRRNQLGGIAQ